MDIEGLDWFFFGNKQSELLGVRWCDFFANENVGERLIVVDEFHVVGWKK